jgi:hypothetical protein
MSKSERATSKAKPMMIPFNPAYQKVGWVPGREGLTEAGVDHEELHGGAYRGPDCRDLEVPVDERISPSEEPEAAVTGDTCGGGFEIEDDGREVARQSQILARRARFASRYKSNNMGPHSRSHTLSGHRRRGLLQPLVSS